MSKPSDSRSESIKWQVAILRAIYACFSEYRMTIDSSGTAGILAIRNAQLGALRSIVSIISHIARSGERFDLVQIRWHDVSAACPLLLSRELEELEKAFFGNRISSFVSRGDFDGLVA